MKFTLEPTITFDDISAGERDDCQNCPIARAINRELHKIRPGIWCSVYPSRVKIWTWKCNYAYFGEEIALFISKFDDKKEVKPFRFKLEIDLDLTP